MAGDLKKLQEINHTADFIKKLKIILFLIFCPVNYLYSQAPDLVWAFKTTGSGSESSGFVVTDNSGNVYIAGGYDGIVDFDPGAGITSINTNGYNDIFIKKTDSFGILIWIKHFGGIYPDGVSGIALDNNNNIYLTGSFSATVDFNPGAGSYFATATVTDMYILKLDNNGNFVWMKQIGCSDEEYGIDIHVSPGGILHVSGQFNGLACDLDPGPAVFSASTSTDAKMFYLKLDLAGNTLDIKKFDGSFSQIINTIRCDESENIYLSGGFYGETDFDPGTDTFTINNGGMLSAAHFAAKLKPNGQLVWAKAFKTTNSLYTARMRLDNMYNLLLPFSFKDSVDLDPDITNFYQYSSGSLDGMLIKLDSVGNVLWFTQRGSADGEYMTIAECDQYNNIYLAGSFSNTVDFDAGAGNYLLSSMGNSDMFIQKMDPNGNNIWAGRYGGTETDGSSDLHVTQTGNIYNVGSFRGTVDLDPDADSTSYFTSPVNTTDAFEIKLIQCKNPVTFSSAVSCGPYSLNSFNYDSSATYYQMLFDDSGCDSILKLDLIVNYVDTSVTLDNPELTAEADSSTFQWVDCVNLFSPVPGANSNVFLPDQNGSYAVVVTENGCTDTSACYNVTGIGIVENNWQDVIKIFPNPSSDFVTIEFPFEVDTKVQILNIQCQMIASLRINHATKFNIDVNELASGFYFIRILNENKNAVLKFIKE